MQETIMVKEYSITAVRVAALDRLNGRSLRVRSVGGTDFCTLRGASRAMGYPLWETRSVQTFNVTSGPVVADYVRSDREGELLRVLDAIGARDVVIGPEGNRVEITFVLDAEDSNAAVTTADGTLTTFAGGFWPGAVVASRID
jgi:hypothetical protein